MMRDKLPNDIEALKDWALQEYRRAEMYKHRCELLTRQRFGPSSEKRKDAPGQGLLFELPTEPEPPAPIVATADEPRHKKHGGGRKPLPPELRRERIEYTLPEDQRRCACCGEPMQPIGEDVTEQREFIPASIYVKQHVRIKYACKKGCQEKPAIAPGPQKVVERISAGPGLLAWNVVSKFLHHQPLYRQEDIFKLHGHEISRSTQCSWLGTVAELLEPLWKRMVSLVLQSRVIHTDDTTIQVQEPGRGKTRTGRFWVYVGDKEHPFIVYDYTPNRSRDGPAHFLKGFRGYLQADAYAGYNGLYAGKDIIEIACWAHARRKFFEALDTDARARVMLDMIGALYAVEDLAQPLTAAARQQLREVQSKPILDRMKAWLSAQALDVLPKSPLGLAVNYALNQWAALCRYVEDGALAIDNNIAENALRPIAVGRKNYLFVGSDKGGRRAAILYSLVRTCEQHNLNAWEYLKDVLIRVSTFGVAIDDLLPHRWKPAQ